MKTEKKLKYILGISVATITAALILFICIVVITTVKSDINLAATLDNDNGWSYEVVSDGQNQSVQPEFIDEYTLSFSQTDISAIRIKRVMTETLMSPYLLIYSYGVGTEVLLDGELIFSNLTFSEHNDDGYIEIPEGCVGRDGLPSETIYVSLPENYNGKTLSITSYFSPDEEFIAPAFPILQTDETFYSGMVSSAFLPNIIISLCCIISLLLCTVFLFSIHYGRTDLKILLLVIFFVMLFINTMYTTPIGQSSRLAEILNLSFLEGLYITPLFIYVALCLEKWRTYVTFSCAIVQFIYYCGSLIIHQHNNEIMVVNDGYISAFAVFIISLAMIIAELLCNKNKRKKYITSRNIITLFCVIITITIIQAYTIDGSIKTYLTNIISSFRFIYFAAIVRLLSSIYGFMTAVTIITNFVSGIINDKNNIAVINERYKLAMSNYNMLLKAENETKRIRHEMSHHINAISTYLNENKTDEAKEYAISVGDKLNRLPALRYCDNLLLNAIVGKCLEQAKASDIKFEHKLNVKEKIGIEDSDLCVLVENMLDNALEACKMTSNSKERFIRININQDDNFIFISCVNTVNGSVTVDKRRDIVTSKEDIENHGYGISTMRLIAEKYNSILKIECTDEEFSVVTNLNLK